MSEPEDESKFSFAGMLDQGMRALDMDATGLCQHFDISVPTVGRWLDGKTAPVPWYRQFVASRLIELVDERMARSDRLEASSSSSAPPVHS